MMELLNLLGMLVLVLAFLALLIGVPLGLVWLLIKGLGRLAGNRNKAMYFLQPLIGIFLLSTGLGGLSEVPSSQASFGSLAFSSAMMVGGAAALVYAVRDEWNQSKQLYELRLSTNARVQRHVDAETQYSTDWHAASGITSTGVKQLRCPACRSVCVLPMGHAVICAGCGCPVSMTADLYVENGSIAHGIVPDDIAGSSQPSVAPAAAPAAKVAAASAPVTTPANAAAGPRPRQVHAMDGRALWGDGTIVKFLCPHCGKQSIGFAGRSRRCLGCGGQLVVNDIVADKLGASWSAASNANGVTYTQSQPKREGGR